MTKEQVWAIVDDFTGALCKRKSVACAIVDDDLSLVNFHTNLLTSTRECSGEKANCGCIHAEMNAIVALLSSPYAESGMNLMMFCSCSPCTNCANLIVLSKCIKRVYYRKLTIKDTRGLLILEAAGIDAFHDPI